MGGWKPRLACKAVYRKAFASGGTAHDWGVLDNCELLVSILEVILNMIISTRSGW